MKRRKLFALLAGAAAAPVAAPHLARYEFKSLAVPVSKVDGYWNTISGSAFTDYFVMRSSVLGGTTMYIARETLENLGMTPDQYLDRAEVRVLAGLHPLFT
jgi:hypothetical protein